MRATPLLVAAFALLAPRTGAAVVLAGDGEGLSLEVHGFASQGFLLTRANNFLAKSAGGSFEFSEAGLNFTLQLTDKLRTGFQLFAHQIGQTGGFDAQMDWFYLDYRWKDWLGLRAGRVKLPFGLYNDTSDIDAARNSILLPQAMYSATNRDFLLAQTGLEVYGYLKMGAGGALDYRFYGGTLHYEVASIPPGRQPFQIQELRTPYIIGGRLMWETPVDGLRLGGSVQALRLDARLALPGMGMMPAALANVKVPAILTVGSIELQRKGLTMAAEYGRWFVDTESDNAAVFPSSPKTTVSERMYFQTIYRLTRWLQPGFYYAVYFRDVDNRAGRANRQHDLAVTVRFDINSHWLIKVEGHFMNGTALLSSALNGGARLDTLEESWGLFLFKLTAHF